MILVRWLVKICCWTHTKKQHKRLVAWMTCFVSSLLREEEDFTFLWALMKCFWRGLWLCFLILFRVCTVSVQILDRFRVSFAWVLGLYAHLCVKTWKNIAKISLKSWIFLFFNSSISFFFQKYFSFICNLINFLNFIQEILFLHILYFF